MPNRRFLIIGLPRSGTTYLMTLLNAHRDVRCSGEQFNPFRIVGVSDVDERFDSIVERDAAPWRFVEKFFDKACAGPEARVGFKFMIGHNIRVLRKLAEDPGLTLIHVWRENKLAQVSSLIKANKSKRWAQVRRDSHIRQKIDATPREISHRWHEYASFDFLFEQWFDTLPHHKLSLEYREMFQPGFEARLCGFLDLPEDPKMKSPLVKQGANTILDRFENPARIERYFRAIGYGHWLEPEL